MTTDELAREWRMKRDQIYRMVKAGMPHSMVKNKKGLKRYEFDLAACQAWYRTSGE